MKSKKPKPTKDLYQFKITLLNSKPPIWRRIQVFDCTLDKLHMHIQTAMGWTNSHLHQFEIQGKPYGNPTLIGDDLFDDACFEDSTKTLLHEILPAGAKKFRFLYEYDFGDGWRHDILCEGSPEPQDGKAYPLCVKGSRACPPEDVGGVWGYAEFLQAISNPKHKNHKMYMKWHGPFNAEQFDSDEATTRMHRGLPN